MSVRWLQQHNNTNVTKKQSMIYCAYMGLTGVMSVYVSAKFRRQRFMFAANKCDNNNIQVFQWMRTKEIHALPPSSLAALATVDDRKIGGTPRRTLVQIEITLT